MNMPSLDGLHFDLTTLGDILQIVFADIILSGDNALVIGMAAAGLAPKQRKKAIAIGMAMAAGMRILFAVIASYLLAIKGILLIGGLLLSWVCWRFYLDLKEFNQASVDTIEAANSEGASRDNSCLLYTSPSPRDLSTSRMPSSA